MLIEGRLEGGERGFQTQGKRESVSDRWGFSRGVVWSGFFLEHETCGIVLDTLESVDGGVREAGEER